MWLCRVFRTRLAARSAIITLAAVGLLGAVSLTLSVFFNEQRERSREYQRLEELLTTVQPTTQVACFLNNTELANEVANGLLSNRVVSHVAITYQDQTLVSAPQNSQSAATTAPVSRVIYSPFDSSEPVCTITLAPNAEAIRSAVLGESIFVSVLLGVQLVAVGVVVILVMVSFVTRPIHRVSRRLEQLEAQTGQKLQIPKGNEHDEIGHLVLSVNAMIDHLVSALRVERDLRLEREVQERRYRSIFENVETGIFELNSEGRITGANPAFHQLFGAEGDDLADVTLQTLVDDSAALVQALHQLSTASPRAELEVSVQVNEQTRWLNLVVTLIEAGQLQGVANDITERRLATDAVEQMALTDPLTGLGNRRSLERRLQAARRIRESDPNYHCVLIMLDLDHFKEANDTFGHAVGDQVLQKVAGLLKGLVRRADFVARSGGDEFIVLLDGDMAVADIERIAQHFLQLVNEPMTFAGDVEVHVGASLGIAMFGQDTEDERELVRLADAAMYAAKNAGRNTYRFHHDS